MERNNQGQQVMKQGYDLKHPLGQKYHKKMPGQLRGKNHAGN